MSINYFSHDYFSRNDPKLLALRMEFGMEGIGIYWSLVEMLYEQCGYININYITISFDLHVDPGLVKKIINFPDLFDIKDDKFTSESVLRRLKIRSDKSMKAANSANSRWNRNTNENINRIANAIEINANALLIKEKENKLNKNKEKENKEKEIVLIKSEPGFKKDRRSYADESILTDFIEAETWFERVSSSYKYSNEFVLKQADLFVKKLKLEDDYQRPINEIRKHFINWLLKKKEIKSNYKGSIYQKDNDND